jgi:hypothetical protein
MAFHTTRNIVRFLAWITVMVVMMMALLIALTMFFVL